MISDVKIAEIRERTDIAEVVGDYITLRRAGSNMKGVCPFHADTDPSFNVNSARQFFHCFGCGASGDVFSFIQRIEGIDFLETARRLAGRYGIDLPEQTVSPAARTRAERAREASRRRRYILEETATFFENRLREAEGLTARELLKSRGIDEETVRQFRLGYAPDSWSSLIDYFKTRNVGPKELEEVGLALVRRSGGFYDRFRNRIVFTIMDPSGQPIAFSARAIEGDSQEQTAKYINSPETAEYTKGKVLYGLYQARVPLSKVGEAVLVEGNFDVVSLAQAGVHNVVSPLGTALTSDQAALLRRRVERVIVMFDGDAAGRNAAIRTFSILAGAGLASYVASLPTGEDPDSLVRHKGKEVVTDLLSQRKGLLDQIIENSAAESDGSTQDTARRIEEMRPLIRALRTSVESDLYRGRIADAFGVDHKTVFKCLRGGWAKELAEQSPNIGIKLPGQVAERELIGLLLDYPAIWDDTSVNETLAMVSTPVLKGLIDEIGHRHKQKDSSVAELIAGREADHVGKWLAERAMVRLYNEKDKAGVALRDIHIKLKQAHIKEQIIELEKQIQKANSQGDEVQVLELSRKKASLQKQSTTKKEQLFDADIAKA
ncbi:MAG: DNA primase [Proteobacteria bacterium]|nr:DNA primase [Pseudomonadota bacterium]